MPTFKDRNVRKLKKMKLKAKIKAKALLKAQGNTTVPKNGVFPCLTGVWVSAKTLYLLTEH